MHINELQRIVLRLSNQAWVRYWVHYNSPCNPVTMAIQIIDVKREGVWKPKNVPDLIRLGFQLDHDDFYVINRTDDAGMPYFSKL